MHVRDHERRNEGCLHRLPKLQSLPVNDSNGCYTYLKSEVQVENYEPDLFEDKPTPCLDKLLSSQQNRHASEENPTTPVDNPLHLDMSINTFLETWDQHSVEEKPITSVDKPVDSEMSLTAPQFTFQDTMVPDSCPQNHSPEKQKDPLAMSPVKGRPDTSDHSTNHLLALAAEALRMRLKPNWICVLDRQGIHTMQLSRNSEKCVQRRIYFNPRGDVHLSVHCVPIPISNFVSDLKMVKLHYEHDVSAFVAAMERVVNIVWQLEICTGVTHEKYKPFWASSTRGKIDENPYQEVRYSVTLRSLQCCRLVRPRKRMCHSCARLLDTLRLKARSRAKKLQSHPMP